MWKLLYQSVTGSSHVKTAGVCQDACLAAPIQLESERVLVAACADGAGSAAFSQIGSRAACADILDAVARDLQDGVSVADISRDHIVKWFRLVHEHLAAKALEMEIPMRELACTLLLAVIGESVAAFGQVGDGSIVVLGPQGYEAVAWPEAAGEYLNLTHFVTEPAFETHLVSTFRLEVQEVALLTDGLQMLALDFSERRPHAPFFQPLFSALRGAASPDDLIVPLRTFLESDSINSRTDDDKTLVLATRVTDGQH